MFYLVAKFVLSVRKRKIPPPAGCCGFSNRDRSLSAEERRELAGFSSRSAPAIEKIAAPPARSSRQQLTDRSSSSFFPSTCVCQMRAGRQWDDDGRMWRVERGGAGVYLHARTHGTNRCRTRVPLSPILAGSPLYLSFLPSFLPLSLRLCSISGGYRSTSIDHHHHLPSHSSENGRRRWLTRRRQRLHILRSPSAFSSRDAVPILIAYPPSMSTSISLKRPA